MKIRTMGFIVFLLLFGFSIQAETDTVLQKPRLILQITIDQMRGDYPTRYQDRLGEGGFRYLMEKGIHYINAHYEHADTETPIGHAALFTGTIPAHNGPRMLIRLPRAVSNPLIPKAAANISPCLSVIV